MVVRMRDLLPARGPIAVPARVIDAMVTIYDRLSWLELIVVPRRNTQRRKLRSLHLGIYPEQRLMLLEALLEPGEDAGMIPERAQPYEGPVKGRASRIGMIGNTPKEMAIDVMVSAAAPKGFTEKPGDVFLTIGPSSSVPRDALVGYQAMTLRLDRGAKRFLISQLEQSITIEGMHFEKAADRNALQRALERARAWLKG